MCIRNYCGQDYYIFSSEIDSAWYLFHISFINIVYNNTAVPTLLFKQKKKYNVINESPSNKCNSEEAINCKTLCYTLTQDFHSNKGASPISLYSIKSRYIPWTLYFLGKCSHRFQWNVRNKERPLLIFLKVCYSNINRGRDFVFYLRNAPSSYVI